MPEIDVIDQLSHISFSAERRENVAKVIDTLIADEVAREINARVSSERPAEESLADDTAAERPQAEEPKRKKKSPTS